MGKCKKNILLLLPLTVILTIVVVYINLVPKEIEADICINEICSRNDRVIYDEQGYFYDYVEIYNRADEAIKLSDYFLSDTAWYLLKYQLPEKEIAPGECVVVFINEEEAGFAIGKEEVIYLSNRQGGIVDSVPVPDIEPNMVYAKSVDSEIWVNNQIPTPNAANDRADVAEMELDDTIEITFSHEAGFYDEPFYLEMVANEDCEIYYTLDGTTPTEKSIRYEAPILLDDATKNANVYSMRTDISVREVAVPDYVIDKCNVIRAVAVSQDGTISREKTASYFVGFDDRYGYEDIYVVSLITDPDNLFSSNRGIYVTGDIATWNQDKNAEMDPNQAYTNYTREGDGWRREAYIEVFDEDGSISLAQNIEISIHGGFSTIYPQKGFNLLTPYGVEKDGYIFKFPNGDEYSSLMLRPGGLRDWKKTQFRDVLNHELVKGRDITVLNGIPCQVFLDGEYWGLYNLQERIDNGFIAKEFGIDIDNLIVTKTDFVVEGNDELYNQYETLIDFVEKADLSKEIFYKQVESMIDIQSFIDYNCFEIYVANCDSISNNVSCWRTKDMTNAPYSDGKWRWIIYDTDDSTGIEPEVTNPMVDSFSAGHWDMTPMEEPLFSTLLENESFKKRFVQTFVDMSYSDFDYDRVSELIDSYTDNYMEAAVISRHRYGEPDYTEESYLADVQVVRDFFAQRRDYILEHMKTNLEIEDIEEYLNAGWQKVD